MIMTCMSVQHGRKCNTKLFARRQKADGVTAYRRAHMLNHMHFNGLSYPGGRCPAKQLRASNM